MELQEALAQDFTIDLTTFGAQTGLPRRIEIWYLYHEDAPYITGTPGPRDWYANVLADPRVIFHLKESLAADIPGTAVVINDPVLRNSVFHARNADWYRSTTPIGQLVAESPMIRIELQLGAATVA